MGLAPFASRKDPEVLPSRFFFTSIYLPMMVSARFGCMKPTHITRFNHQSLALTTTPIPLGFSDRDFSTEKPLGCRRILCFGDSFTEGDGAPVDSAYPVLLEHALHAIDSSTLWEVWNVGLCGSDPIFNYMTYEELLRTFEADLIIQTISENDIKQDFVIRGGMNRYNAEGELAIESPVWWEAIYANSHVARLFLHYLGGYDYTLMAKNTTEAPSTGRWTHTIHYRPMAEYLHH